MKNFSIVVAMDEKNGIGKNNDLAWRLSADLKHFKEITTAVNQSEKQNVVIMGRKTWESLPEKFRPLPGRLNVVLSQKPTTQVPAGVLLCSSLDQALEVLETKADIEKIFVIGGAQIFTYAISHRACERIYMTHIKGDFACDTFFPAIPASFDKREDQAWLVEGLMNYRFSSYSRLTI